MSTDTPHPAFDRLSDFVEGRLSADEEEEMQQHLSMCAGCAADVAWLEDTMSLTRTDTGEDAPLWVTARAVRLLREQAATSSAPQPARWRRVIAALEFDSATMPLAFGMRSGGAGARQLLYRGEEYDLDLRVAPEGAWWHVSGQLLGPTTTTGQVALAGGAGRAEATLDALGAFSLAPVPTGEYTVRLRTDAVEVEVTTLRLGE